MEAIYSNPDLQGWGDIKEFNTSSGWKMCPGESCWELWPEQTAVYSIMCTLQSKVSGNSYLMAWEQSRSKHNPPVTALATVHFLLGQ